MRLSGRRIERASKCELSMTSMIDVVFLLLIFFLTTTAFVKPERELNPAIKVDRPSTQQSPSDLEPAVVQVVRGESGFVYRVGGREINVLAGNVLAGNVLAGDGLALSDEDLSRAAAGAAQELVGVLRQFENKADGAFVQVSDEAPFQLAAVAVQACKSANFTAVSYVPLVSSE
jgi:biopolymer transport protein ExbD